MHVGERFFVQADGGLGIRIASGRAWFDNTWSYNDDNMFLTITSANPLGDRIDVVALEVDRRDDSRTNSIRIIEGAPVSASPVPPTLIRSEYVNQYPLAHILVPRGITNITQAHITNMVGTSQTPFVTGPLETINLDQQLAQWQAQWLAMFNNQQTNWQNQTDEQQRLWLLHMDILNSSYLELINLIYALETGLFVLINNNFDDWSVRNGCRHHVAFQGNGSILETIHIISSNFLLAQKVTTFNNRPDGSTESVVEVVQFRPYIMEDTFGGTVRRVVTTGNTMTRITTFNTDGTITAIISGVSGTLALLDSAMNQLVTNAMENLAVWE